MKVYNLVCRFKRKYPMTVAQRLREHSRVAASVVDRDEEVYYAFCGQKNDSYKIFFDTCVVIVTNKRIIIGQKRLLWGYKIITVIPELFNDLKLFSGFIWGKVEIDTVKEVIWVSNIDKKSLDEIETNVNKIMLENKRRLSKGNDNYVRKN